MANLQVKNVPEGMYDELRRRAGLEQVTIRDYVLALLREDQERPRFDEWLDRVREIRPVVGDLDSRALIEAGRQERDTELASGTVAFDQRVHADD